MLEAAHDGADWRDVSRIVLHIDPDADASRARHAFDSHMIRARWMTTHGFLLLPNPLEHTGAPTFDPAISCPPASSRAQHLPHGDCALFPPPGNDCPSREDSGVPATSSVAERRTLGLLTRLQPNAGFADSK